MTLEGVFQLPGPGIAEAVFANPASGACGSAMKASGRREMDCSRARAGQDECRARAPSARVSRHANHLPPVARAKGRRARARHTGNGPAPCARIDCAPDLSSPSPSPCSMISPAYRIGHGGVAWSQ